MNQVVAEEHQVSETMSSDEISEISDAMSGSNEIVSDPNCFQHFVANGFCKIDQSSLETCIIETSVAQNLQVDKRARVVAIHKNMNNSRSWQIRAHSFAVSMKAVADKCGGGANPKYAWYGASLDEIREIVTHGFSWRMKAAADTHSISLSPAKHLLDSVLRSTVDESGLRHLLLCRVILGKQEVVIGDSSDQFHPSSSEFDSGVDDISAPRKYIVWNSRLNFSVFLCYIVSLDVPYLSGFKEATIMSLGHHG
ncbi:RCD one 2, putative isoform 2 [Hibiscus syriacus]|uniref:RCD one 2, putative isoform 2 n=1 Tax=Hibiscus syriacus TaxID=106335 RepID=A0A6A3AWR7_HIBSY|nr:probable inactive poly [ADP-ribose] polymerase SRO2 [Hibiscus syriacus]KAE8707259.1 RCD one 2, putative isoform 2 [Hibiscus syriacus]